MRRWPLHIKIVGVIGIILTLTVIFISFNYLNYTNKVIDDVNIHMQLVEDNYRMEYKTDLYNAEDSGVSSASPDLSNKSFVDGDIIITDGMFIEDIESASAFIEADVVAEDMIKVVVIVVVVNILIIISIYFIIKQILRPLNQLKKQIQHIDSNSLNQVIVVDNSNNEVRELADSFNVMLNKLDKSFQSQKIFSANVAHELKTPLASMKSSLDVVMMDDEPDPIEVKEMLQDLNYSINRMVGLVDELLLLSHEDIINKNDNIDVNEMFEEIIDSLQVELNKKNMTYQIQGRTNLESSKTLIYHGFYNLIENAIKYGKDKGHISIDIESGEQVIITIEDDGIGIAPENLEFIFNPLFREDESRAQTVIGHGLGLPVVKSIVERHNGTIEIASEKGVKTKVIVRI